MNTENLLLQRQCLGNHVTTSARGRDILLPSATTLNVRCVVSGHPEAGTRGSAVCTRYLHAYTVSEMREAHKEGGGLQQTSGSAGRRVQSTGQRKRQCYTTSSDNLA